MPRERIPRSRSQADHSERLTRTEDRMQEIVTRQRAMEARLDALDIHIKGRSVEQDETYLTKARIVGMMRKLGMID